MEAEESRELVLRFCQLLSDRKLDEMFDLIAEHGTWAGVGRPDLFAYGGVRSKAQSIEMIGGFLRPFDSFKFDVNSSIVEGQRVAIEASSQGVGPGAKRYANEYILTFECADGKITRIVEFFDQLAVLDYIDQAE